MSGNPNTETPTTETPAADDKPASKGDTVSRDAYEKAIKEKRNAMTALEQLKSEVSSLKDEKLKEQNQYKELYEKVLGEKSELQRRMEQVEQEKVLSYKLTAVKKEFEKMGANPKSLEFLLQSVNKDTLKYDPDHKMVLGAEDEAKRIKEHLPEVFGKTAANASHDTPKLEAKDMTLDSFKKLPLADKKKSLADVYKAQGITLKP
jgi:predicted nuclease with TOPRIM domain